MTIDDETYIAIHNSVIDLVQYEIRRLIVWHPMLPELLKSTDSLRLNPSQEKLNNLDRPACKIEISSI